MNQALYAPSKFTIDRYRCVALDDNDKMLSGSRGWIFVANKAGTRLGVVTCTFHGGEKIKYHDFSYLEKAISAIGFYRTLLKAPCTPITLINDTTT